jgi:hypothetical protein
MLQSQNPSSFGQLRWLFPFAITLHNLEEAVWLPGFVAAHRTELPWTVAAGEFRFGATVLTVAAWIVTYLSWRTGRERIWAYLLFGYVVAMLVNVFVPHVVAAIIFRGYAPGMVTAVALNLPVLTLLSIRAIRDRFVSGRKAVVFVVAVPVGIVLLSPTLFALGRWLV